MGGGQIYHHEHVPKSASFTSLLIRQQTPQVPGVMAQDYECTANLNSSERMCFMSHYQYSHVGVLMWHTLQPVFQSWYPQHDSKFNVSKREIDISQMHCQSIFHQLNNSALLLMYKTAQHKIVKWKIFLKVILIQNLTNDQLLTTNYNTESQCA